MSKKEKLPTESYKGVRDFYPEDQAVMTYLTQAMRRVAESFGYVEYHASILEPSELYKSKNADNAEIINEQTYTFTDRGGREVTLRPEMTPTLARMVAAKRRDLGFPLRLYSIPNLFRYERPQRGRLREHWQLNIDIFGSNTRAADAEVVAIAHNILTTLGGKEEDFIIKLGSRPFLNRIGKELALSGDSLKALTALLDRRDKIPKEEFDKGLLELGVPAAKLSPNEPPEDVAEVLTLLAGMGVTNAVFDPSIVRGFAYYTGVVFEVYDTRPENRRALFGGGRYDNLIELFDDEKVPGVGFGMGDVALQDFLEVRGLLPAYRPPTDVYLAVAGPDLVPDALALAEELREKRVCVAVDFGDKKLGDQLRNAAKHKVPWLVVVGPDEVSSGTFTAHNLENGTDEHLTRAKLAEFLLNR